MVGALHQFIGVAKHDPHDSHRRHKRDQRDKCERHIDTHQIQKDHDRSYEIADQIRQTVRQKQLQLLYVLV